MVPAKEDRVRSFSDSSSASPRQLLRIKGGRPVALHSTLFFGDIAIDDTVKGKRRAIEEIEGEREDAFTVETEEK